jgi:hypothetical protein
MLEHVPVAERALVARINRKLAKHGESLRRCPPSSRWHLELGDYYAIDLNVNAVVRQRIPLESWGRELGCLRPW